MPWPFHQSIRTPPSGGGHARSGGEATPPSRRSLADAEEDLAAASAEVAGLLAAIRPGDPDANALLGRLADAESRERALAEACEWLRVEETGRPRRGRA